MMTPQQLIDLPGYGSARHELRADGRWRDTMTDQERIDWLGWGGVVVHNLPGGRWSITRDRSADPDPYLLRAHIDAAAQNAKEPQ